MADTDQAIDALLGTRRAVSAERSVLAAISGIDGSGKGYITGQLAEGLAQHGVKVATINIDGWLNLPARRFSTIDPAERFYEHAIRFREMFAELALPLKAHRTIHLVADFDEETATAYETIYFPAQRIHFVRDDPRRAADLIIPNDPRLAVAGPSCGGRPPSTGDDGSAPAPGGA